MQRSNNAKISHQDTEHAGRQKNYAPFNSNTASVLTLPRLNPDIDTKISAGGFTPNVATLALNLLRKGLIEEKAEGETSHLIQEAIQKWVGSLVGDIKHFNFELEIRPELQDLEFACAEDDADLFLDMVEKEHGSNVMFLNFIPGDIPVLNIGKTLEVIEAKVEGLGQTAYHWLAVSGAQLLDIYTPWRGTDMAEYVWWMGNDSEADFVEQIKSEYEDDEEYLQQRLEYSPAKWRASFPKWAVDISNPLSEDDLKAISIANPESLESQVAQMVLKIIENKDSSFPQIHLPDLMGMHSSMYLQWAEGDISHRLVDDFYQDVSQTGGEGYTESLATFAIPSKPFQFRKWMASMEKAFVQLKNIEQLVNLIVTR